MNTFTPSNLLLFKVVLLSFSIILSGCNRNATKIPAVQLKQNKVEFEKIETDSLIGFRLFNTVECPLRFKVGSNNAKFLTLAEVDSLYTVPPRKDLMLVAPRESFVKEEVDEIEYKIQGELGDLQATVIEPKLTLPFPKGRTYKILQGYNGAFSHAQSDYSRFALDFNLLVGDTICAAADGVVVGVIEGYISSGGSALRDYANYITIFHPQFNVYTQYAHLVHNGSFVNVGDNVLLGQAIGLSGNTGFTDGPHLHFNTLVPATFEEGLKSIPVTFLEGYDGRDLTKGVIIKK